MKKFGKLILSLLCALLLTGCGEDEALDVYQADMETFFGHMAEFDENMNAIDVGQEDYVVQLLEYLDALDAEVAWMAELEVPEQFSVVDDLADEASENMSQAVSYFHMAYEGEEFNPNYEEAARSIIKEPMSGFNILSCCFMERFRKGKALPIRKKKTAFSAAVI